MNSQKNSKHRLIVIDPCLKIPEVGSLNLFIDMSPIKVEYFLPSVGRLSALEVLNKNLDNPDYKGCVILGSGASVNDSHDFQDVLQGTIQKCLDHHIPLLGICYGHQLMASMFGAKVDFRDPSQKKNMGVRQLSPQKDHSFWSDLISETVSAWVSHKEHVVDVPQNTVSIATRDDCEVEGLHYQNEQAWSFQAHPETGEDILLRRKRFQEDPQKLKTALDEIESGRYILEEFISCLNS